MNAKQRYDVIRDMMDDLRADMVAGRVSFTIADAIDVQSAVLNMEIEADEEDEALAKRVQDMHANNR